MMRFKTLALSAAAAAALAGLAGIAAAAAIQNSHVLTVTLPDGGVARIRYFGKTPPQVRIERAGPMAPADWPGFAASFGPGLAFGGVDPGFAALDRAMAQMDRENDLMLAQAQAQAQALMRAGPAAGGLERAGFGQLPPGASGYSFVSTSSGRGVCMRSVEYRSTGNGRPQVISRTSGDCGPGAAATTAPRTAAAPTRASAGGATPALRFERVADSRAM